MELMTQVIWPYLDSFVVFSIDDILVYLLSWEQHSQHLFIVLYIF